MEVLVKTTFVFADNVAGGDKILVDGIAREVYNADYVVPEWTSTVRIETVEGDVLVYGSTETIEKVVEE